MSAYLEPLDNSARCQKWKLRWSVGRGKERVQRSRVFVGGKREATAALREFERECQAAPGASSTFGAFAAEWNDQREAAGSVQPSTAAKYRWHIRTLDGLNGMQLREIKPSHILAEYQRLKTERGVSGTTLRAVHNSLTRIFRAAVDEGVIAASPMTAVDAPQVDTPQKRALAPDAAQTVLGLLPVGDNRSFAVSLALRCGLRRKEVLGLEWRDVDAQGVHVRREVTKSAAGVRTIPLDADTKLFIDARHALVEVSLMDCGAELRPDDALCCGLDGRPLTANALRLWWQRHRAEYGLDGWTLHELRHTYLTNLAQAGVHPAVMQRLAGHSSMRTTMEIYTHVHDEDAQAAVDALEALRSTPKSAPAFPRFSDRFSN